MATKIAAFQAIADLRPRSGGTSRVVVDLADALAQDAAIDPVVVTQSLVGESSIPSLSPRVQRIFGQTLSARSLRLGLPFREALRQAMTPDRQSVIHNHGLWLPVNHWASRIARQLGIPLISQPHGMLEPWALNHRAWKKRIAMALFQRQDLETASVLVATAQSEYENIRKLGFRQPIAVIPNGVEINTGPVDRDNRSPLGTRERTLLFLSRIHPKKGLENLVHAWAQILPRGWRLCIAGPDEEGYLHKVIGLARELGVENTVDFVGPIDGERKRSMYKEADLFVLPTYSENFGVVVAEALAHGVPVITTRGAPWADLKTHGCGWWIDIGVEPLVKALQDAFSLTDDARRSMGVRGRDYVQRYNWGDIALQMGEVYRWALDEGPQPDCVRLS